MVDEASTWPEIMPITNKEARNITKIVDLEWLCRYPRAEYCIHDNGKEFVGEEFEKLLE